MSKNIVVAVAVLLFLLPAAWAAAPVWTAIADQQVTVGNTLQFNVSASDADGDALILRIASPPVTGVNFTANGGNGTFTWTPTSNQVGTPDFIFGASANGEETFETARIMVNPAASNNTTNTSLSPEEQEYNRLLSEFNELEDDYSLAKRRYERAVDDDDENDIDDYADELEDIDDDLADVEDDVEDLLDDVEDSTLSNRRELADDVEDLQEDIERVRERIDDLLNGDEEQDAGTLAQNYVPPPRIEPEQRERTRVVVQPLEYAGAANTIEPSQDTWPETRKIVLLGAGAVVLLAIIIFLVALMV